MIVLHHEALALPKFEAIEESLVNVSKPINL